MAVLGVLLIGLTFFLSLFIVGMLGGIFYYLTMPFIWIMITGVFVQLRNQLMITIENVFLKKEIFLQIGIILGISILNIILRSTRIIGSEIFNTMIILTIISCGYVVVDTIIYFKNKKELNQ